VANTQELLNLYKNNLKREDKMKTIKYSFYSYITGKFFKILRLMLLILFIGITGIAYATNIRGQLLRIGPYGDYPATNIGLHLENIMSPGIIVFQPIYTNAFGMYYFYNIPGGDYLLVVPRRNAPALKYRIRIPNWNNDPRVFYDIAPITLP
jgi:hypothetical protein